MLSALTLLVLSNAIQAVPKCYIKNDSGWDIKIKFAAPDNMRAVESPISNGDKYSLGDPNEMLRIIHLSVARQGLGSDYLSGFTALNVQQLKEMSRRYLSEQNIPGYERDIYWVITSTWTGWTAKAVSVQRSVNGK